MNIPKRIAAGLINALKGGVVPRIGLPYIAVGRTREIEALLHDIEMISQGGASFRFIMGKYGSGKSFLLQTIRNYAMDKNFAVVDADLSPERRLQGTKGQGLATYKELIKNLSVKTKPDGGALSLILDRWINNLQSEVITQYNLDYNSPQLVTFTRQRIRDVITQINELVHGFDFAKLLDCYYEGYIQADDERKAKVLKWFRGEYETKAQVKADLGIRIMITDEDWYEYLKILAMFLKTAGYSGMLILIDELVNIYKIPNAVSRQYNYEKILTMYNDTLQGKAQYIGMILCGTPQCIEDKHRGVYSYEALRSRLEPGKYAGIQGVYDLMAPIIRLVPLTHEEMFVLIEKLRDIHAAVFSYTPTLTQDQMLLFIKMEYERIGAETNITPREVIRDFIELLDIFYQNPTVCFEELVSETCSSLPIAQQTCQDTDEPVIEFEF